VPFHGPDGEPFDGLHLREWGPDDWNAFRLERTVVYTHPRWPGQTFEAPAGTRTDLASVPWPVWGVIAPLGRQARAAVLHDHGSALARTDPPAQGWERRRTIDDVFRVALEETGVSRLRAHVMWAAVGVGRYVEHRTAVGVLLIAFVVAWWAALVWGVVAGASWPVWVGLAAAAGLACLIARRDAALVASLLALGWLYALLAAAALVTLAVQVVVWAVAWVVSLVHGGPRPVIRPTRVRVAGR